MKTKERNGYEPRLFELPLSSVFHCSMYCSSCLLYKSRRKTYDKSFVEKEASDVYRCFFFIAPLVKYECIYLYNKTVIEVLGQLLDSVHGEYASLIMNLIKYGIATENNARIW